jgi:hypothetical protein
MTRSVARCVTGSSSVVANQPGVDLVLSAENVWVDESAVSTEWTGEWSNGVEYDSDGRAPLGGDNVFTANTPSGGNRVTMTVTATFCDVPGEVSNPPDGAQGAVWLGTNGCFQVWTLGNVANVEMLPTANANSQLDTGNIGNGNIGNTGNIPMWVDVEADGVIPTIGVDYTFRFTFDYAAQTYSVAVQYGAEWKPLVGRVIPNAQTFPLATSASAVSGVRFTGDGVFTSMLGEWMKKNLGFVLRLF